MEDGWGMLQMGFWPFAFGRDGIRYLFTELAIEAVFEAFVIHGRLPKALITMRSRCAHDERRAAMPCDHTVRFSITT
jgi:hypothetical protein